VGLIPATLATFPGGIEAEDDSAQAVYTPVEHARFGFMRLRALQTLLTSSGSQPEVAAPVYAARKLRVSDNGGMQS
jgi:hypothetical protein